MDEHQLSNSQTTVKMKLVVVFATVLAVSSAQFNAFGPQPTRNPIRYPSSTPGPRPTVVVNRVVNNDRDANIVRFENEIYPDGSYNYAYETDNGISAQAQGTPRDFGGNPPVVPIVSQGGYSYTSPEGQPISITYIADENGYQPQGDSIPTPPPIPAAILKALEYIARNPPAPQKN